MGKCEYRFLPDYSIHFTMLVNNDYSTCNKMHLQIRRDELGTKIHTTHDKKTN